MKTKVLLSTRDPLVEKLDALVVLLVQGDRPPQELDEVTGGAAGRACELGDFRGARRQTTLLYGGGKAARVLLVGLGAEAQLSAARVREGVGSGLRALRSLGLARVGLRGPAGLEPATFAAAAAEAGVLGNYRFERHKTPRAGKRRRAGSTTLVVFAPRRARKALERATIVAEAANLARELGNEPGNVMTPTALAAAARREGRKAGCKVKVLGPAELKRLGMGGLLGVSAGSTQPPRFVEMVYTPPGKARGGTVCLVGKGVTFDAGGISLKPSDKMWEMKFDKCGACAVIGAVIAAARCKLPLKVIGLVAATENLPDGSATKPGDVLTALNGKTIEVLNTDAEGRLALADALSYAARFKADAIVDLATLTGGCVVALGDVRAGVMSPNPALREALRAAGERSGDRVWPLPLDEDYGEHVKSEVADVKNLGRGREAVSIAGGWFLRHFAPEGVPWAHVDIAGPAWNSSDPGRGCIGAGATGFGVRLAFEYLRARCEG